MTQDEVRESVGEPDEAADMKTMMLAEARKVLGVGEDDDLEAVMRELAEAEGVELPEQEGELEFPTADIWTYFDAPEAGNSTSVSFEDGRVAMVTYAAKD